MEDPNPLVRGRGCQALRDCGIEVDTGIGRDEAARLNQPYLTAMRRHRPFVILKAATSLDGRLAAAHGVRTALTSMAADRHAHEQRAQIDAIAVGSGTVLVDDPLLTARHVYRARPFTRVIFDRGLRTPPGAALFSTLPAGPVIIVTSAAAVALHGDRARALEQAGATLLAAGSATVSEALRALGEQGTQSIVFEGGPTLHQAVWDAGVVDYVQLYVAPVALGGGPEMAPGPAAALSSLVERKVRMLGPDVLVEGYVHRPR
jgi:diaminohydroxyphosphoribosylaminopyrimidine deaminase/5-amino-6-(5-phosphoribosylamino)uracil reductase